MNLTDKNKKILEKIFKGNLSFCENRGSEYEFYDICTLNCNYTIGYNKRENHYFTVTNCLTELNKCNKIIIIKVGVYYVHFVFLDDLKNIKI